jgi:hypothetical protein
MPATILNGAKRATCRSCSRKYELLILLVQQITKFDNRRRGDNLGGRNKLTEADWDAVPSNAKIRRRVDLPN